MRVESIKDEAIERKNDNHEPPLNDRGTNVSGNKNS